MNNEYSICLNMIVKNESHVIESTLKNILSYIPISYYVISDTGSTDNTIQIISDFFKSRNINGEIYEDEWKDFGTNRSIALKHAYKKTDYLFIFDADDSIHGDLILPKLVNDSYLFKFGNSTVYKRILLINNHLKWSFVGILHEYIKCDENKVLSECMIQGSYYIDSGKNGDRSKDDKKYEKDAILLEKAFYEAEQKNDDIKIRYSFYTAQSYRDSNQKEKAIEWYKKRTAFKNADQEEYYSYYMIGNLYEDLKEFEKAIYYWTLAIEIDNTRYETPYKIISHFKAKNNYKLAYLYYQMIQLNNYNLDEKLFADYQIYDFMLEHELSIILYYAKKFTEGISIYNKLFLKNLNIEYQINILENFIFYLDYIPFDLDLFTNYFNFVRTIYLKSYVFKPHHLNNIKNVADKMSLLHLHNNVDNVNTFENKSNPIIFLSMTTCKRYDLFIKTVNSLLISFKDIKMVDYFLCVDDNSSDEDRIKMKSKYPFFDFIFKNRDNKGHLSSMNIIWDKLNELKPKYWIHIEDDWLFVKPYNYIERSIQFLNKHKDDNIHQILFNKNYAETFYNYDYVGGEKIDDLYLLHIKDEPNLTEKNCAYWAHYSFRPSVCLVETILKLGNFSSENTFFENDYAYKYYNNGYKSAFFNEITSIHIGKLCNEKSSNKNAYQLNDIKQFNNDKLSNIDKSKYIFIKCKDHYGDDIFFDSDKNNLFSNAESNENVIGFNTLGYFKNNININNLITLNNESDGLYINIERYRKKYNIKMINNDYLKFQNKIIKNHTIEIINNNYLEYIEDNKDCIGYSIDKNMNATMKNNINISMLEDCENTDTIINLNKYIKMNYTDFTIKEPFIKIIKNYIFLKNYDYPGNDIYLNYNLTLNDMIKYSDLHEECVAFNTYGFFKNNIDISNLSTNEYINKDDHGIYIKIDKINKIDKIRLKNVNTLDEDFKNDDDSIAFHSLGFYKKNLDLFNPPIIENPLYNNFLEINIKKIYENEQMSKKNSEKIRVKVISNLCSSLELCELMNKMSMGWLNWNKLEITCNDDFIDYYVIINGLAKNAYFIPEKSIYFYTSKCRNNIKNQYPFMHSEYLDLFIWNFENNYMDLKYNIISKKYDMCDKSFYENNILEYKYIKLTDESPLDFIYNAFLAECLILYYGDRSNLKNFNENSIIFLDDKEDKVDLNGLWESKIDDIKKDKIKILDQMNIFNKIDKIISLHIQ